MTDLPPALLAGWVLWLIGGLLLMLWFRWRSAAMPRRGAAIRPAPATPRGKPAAKSPGASTAPSPAKPAADAFAELHALPDAPDGPPRRP